MPMIGTSIGVGRRLGPNGLSPDVPYPSFPGTLIADFRTKAGVRNINSTQYAQWSDVPSSDNPWGLANIAQVAVGAAAVGSPQTWAGAAVLAAPVDIRNGSLRWTFKAISGFGVDSPVYLDRFMIRLYSGVSNPAAPGANYLEFSQGIGNLPSMVRALSTAPDNATPGRFQSITFHTSDATVVGGTGANLAAFNYMELYVRDNGNGHPVLQPGIVEFVPNARTKGTVLWRLDDLDKASWQWLRATLAPYGWNMTIYPGAMRGILGGAGIMNAADIASAVAAGDHLGAQALDNEVVADYLAMGSAGRTQAFNTLRDYQAQYAPRSQSQHWSWFTQFLPKRRDVASEPEAIFQTAMRFGDGGASQPPIQLGETWPFGDRLNVRCIDGANANYGGLPLNFWPSHVAQAKQYKGVAAIGLHAQLAADGVYRTAVETTLDDIHADRENLDCLTTKQLVDGYVRPEIITPFNQNGPIINGVEFINTGIFGSGSLTPGTFDATWRRVSEETYRYSVLNTRVDSGNAATIVGYPSYNWGNPYVYRPGISVVPQQISAITSLWNRLKWAYRGAGDANNLIEIMLTVVPVSAIDTNPTKKLEVGLFLHLPQKSRQFIFGAPFQNMGGYVDAFGRAWSGVFKAGSGVSDLGFATWFPSDMEDRLDTEVDFYQLLSRTVAAVAGASSAWYISGIQWGPEPYGSSGKTAFIPKEWVRDFNNGPILNPAPVKENIFPNSKLLSQYGVIGAMPAGITIPGDGTVTIAASTQFNTLPIYTPLQNGVTYNVSFDITAYTSGGVRLDLSNNQSSVVQGTARTAIGSYTQPMVATATTNAVRVTTTGTPDNTLKISNIRCVPA